MKKIRNKPASVLARLKNVAQINDIDYNAILILYMQDNLPVIDAHVCIEKCQESVCLEKCRRNAIQDYKTHAVEIKKAV
jgi:hypothetical protein